MWRVIQKPPCASSGVPGAKPMELLDEDKMCGVCLEIVVDKAKFDERMFGILANCNHCYCVKCIRTWRKMKHEQANTCPECRIESPFYIPTRHWVEPGPEKDNLIEQCREYLANIPCIHFNRGMGRCLFGPRCRYSHMRSGHALPSGHRGPLHFDQPRSHLFPTQHRGPIHFVPRRYPSEGWGNLRYVPQQQWNHTQSQPPHNFTIQHQWTPIAHPAIAQNNLVCEVPFHHLNTEMQEPVFQGLSVNRGYYGRRNVPLLSQVLSTTLAPYPARVWMSASQ